MQVKVVLSVSTIFPVYPTILKYFLY